MPNETQKGSSAEPTPTPQPVDFAEFLETMPPGVNCPVEMKSGVLGMPGKYYTTPPELQLHCEADHCRGTRFFQPQDGTVFLEAKFDKRFLTYQCRNCGGSTKFFALFLRRIDDNHGEAYKLGEYPPFGPSMPSKVMSLIGPDRELFLRGRRAENLGLGIGAYAYYRRVVESQWQRILDEIIRVAERLDASETTVKLLRAAREETQFGKAVNTAKAAIPDVLRIDGHNPLTLLHKALSEGLHDRSEDECLGLATSVRLVLTDLAERMAQALKDERELKEAVSRLLNRP